VRKLLLAAFAAWIAASVIAVPSAVHAQGRWERVERGDGQGRARGQDQQQQQPDARRNGGFSRMLGDIAGARLNRSHIDKRPQSRDGGGRNQPRGRGNGGF
jgi:hypothetical protein